MLKIFAKVTKIFGRLLTVFYIKLFVKGVDFTNHSVENKEKVSKEIEEIANAMISKDSTYELKYNVEVDKRFLGMSLKLKK